MNYPIILRKNGATVKIYAHFRDINNIDGTRYHTICWKGANGREREVRVSETAARARAKEILNDLCAGRADRVKISAVLLSYWHSCAEKLGTVPLMEAVDFYLDKHKPKLKTATTLAIQMFMVSKALQGVGERHLATLRHHLNHFNGAFPNSWIGDLTSKDIEGHLSIMTNLQTRRNHRISLITFGRWAVDAGYLTESPFEKTTNPIVPPTDPGILTPKELRAVLAQADECTKKFIVLGAFAGLRASEILRVKWSDLDWISKLIILGRDQTKTRRRRTVHIQPNLQLWLEKYCPLDASLIVDCPNPHLGLRKAVKAAGVVWKHNALRHSSISYMMALTRNAASTAEQHGNSEAQVQENYKANVTEADAKDWYSILP